jgi:hypothetical protein
MAKTLSKAARDALAATDWSKIDAMRTSPGRSLPIPMRRPIWRPRSTFAQSGAPQA